MEHYDWNEGWLFAPTFDPALVRPECPELSLPPVRLPHTVKPLPYNYCNENDYQRLCGYRREFFAPKEWLGRTVLLTGRWRTTPPCSATGGGCSTMAAATPPLR